MSPLDGRFGPSQTCAQSDPIERTLETALGLWDLELVLLPQAQHPVGHLWAPWAAASPVTHIPGTQPGRWRFCPRYQLRSCPQPGIRSKYPPRKVAGRALGLNPSITTANSVPLAKFLSSVFSSETQTSCCEHRVGCDVVKHGERCRADPEPQTPTSSWVGVQAPCSPSCLPTLSAGPPAAQETEDWVAHTGVSSESHIGLVSSWL